MKKNKIALVTCSCMILFVQSTWMNKNVLLLILFFAGYMLFTFLTRKDSGKKTTNTFSKKSNTTYSKTNDHSYENDCAEQRRREDDDRRRYEEDREYERRREQEKYFDNY
jgi:ABC-type nickel/cobalt efflux system permease component RcnA